jgi:hypothetical protein
MNVSEQIINHLYLLTFILFLFVLSAFLAQKTEKQFIVKFGIILLITFFLTLANLLLILIG